MPYVRDCVILENEEVAPDHFRMQLEAPEIAQEARPAQFCMLQVQPGYFPLLRRPMSFERVYESSVSLLYKVAGDGTRLLSEARVGQEISVQGPLGNGFPLDEDFARHILVAGGIGVAPFPALAEALVSELGRRPEVIIAARTKSAILCDDYFAELGCDTYVATDDGSLGVQGNAAQMLEELHPGPRDRVYVCGPMIMMSTTSEVAVRGGASCLVALEAQMACGDGVCLGCVVESKKELEGEKMVRVCCDGPVFDTTIIDWEAHNMAYDR